MIVDIGNEDMFILIRVENAGLMKGTCLEKSHIASNNIGGGC